MPTTYEPIATTTISGTSTFSVTFSSFSGYTDLIVIVNASAAGDSNFFLRVNGDTGTNYSTTNLTGTGSAAGSSGQSSVDKILAIRGGFLRTTPPAVAVFNFQNYANTTTFKTILSRGNQTDVIVNAQVNLWRSTSAITSINFFVDNFNYSAGSTFTLYGIKAA